MYKEWKIAVVVPAYNEAQLIAKTVTTIPKNRRIGNGALTLLTKITSGYWGIVDPQNGYTAISRRALKEMRFNNISILGVKNETSCYDTCL